ncbi:MAG: DUF420 domain-containing protein [Planctomycetes bacterium]|nr:DUF420 domain-containing protein [Planctomycetota bacterium]
MPRLNATLNASSAALLMTGLIAIKSRRVGLHKMCMLTAFGLSILFLVSYLVYHAHHGTTRFPGQGWVRPVYFTMLWTHMACAASLVPLCIVTLRRAFRKDFEAHRRIAKWTLPIWLYVSVTGVLVYVFLYIWFPT